jgi:hypothetical protein
MAETTDIRELRESQEKYKEEHEKSQAALAQAQTENRILKAQLLGGLNETQAKAFATATAGAEVTAESVKSWSEGMGIGAATPEPAKDPAPTKTESEAPKEASGEAGESSETNKGLALVGNAGSKAGEGGQLTPGTEMLNSAQLTELAKTDPVAADKALREGRVRFSKENFYVQSGLIRQQ